MECISELPMGSRFFVVCHGSKNNVRQTPSPKRRREKMSKKIIKREADDPEKAFWLFIDFRELVFAGRRAIYSTNVRP
jgi:hypothetical protein